MGKQEQIFARIDCGTRKIDESPVPEKYRRLSGRGLTSRLLLEEMDPACHPLSGENILVLAPGLFAGSPFSSSNRLSAGAKSPLTGGIKEANSGGVAAHKLGKLGYRALILTGKPSEKFPSWGLKISKKGISFEDLSDLAGKNSYESAREIKNRFGKNVGCAIIGWAGEMCLSTACIDVTDMEGEPCRNLGRGGLGAVMGSKGIKAIIFDDEGTEPVTKGNSEAMAIIKEFAGMLREHPVTGEKFPMFGTAMTLLNVDGLGGLPTRNFSAGTYEDAEMIGAPKLHDTIEERGGLTAHACMPGCVIRCSNKYVDKKGEPVVGSVDFETICLLGSNIGLSDLDQVAELNLLCNDIGIDTMETGVALGVLCEAGLFEFGDFNSIRDAVRQIGEGTPLGRLLGSGADACGKAYGVTRVPTVKGQGMAAYDPRVIKGMGVTYALSPMGADHTAGNAITLEADHTDPADKVNMVRDLHVNTMLLDTMGVCIFTGRVMLKNLHFIERMLHAMYGWDVTVDELKKEAEQSLLAEVEFNRRAGITEASDDLPHFMRTEKLPPLDMTFEITAAEMKELYNFG